VKLAKENEETVEMKQAKGNGKTKKGSFSQKKQKHNKF